MNQRTIDFFISSCITTICNMISISGITQQALFQVLYISTSLYNPNKSTLTTVRNCALKMRIEPKNKKEISQYFISIPGLSYSTLQSILFPFLLACPKHSSADHPHNLQSTNLFSSSKRNRCTSIQNCNAKKWLLPSVRNMGSEPYNSLFPPQCPPLVHWSILTCRNINLPTSHFVYRNACVWHRICWKH